MDTLDKVQFIQSDAVPKDGELYEISTSIKAIYSCGCVVVRHAPSSGQAARRPDDTDESYVRRRTEREFFAELCPEHLPIFRQQMVQKEFVELRCECFRCIRETIGESENKAHYAPMLADVQPKVCQLEDCLSVRNTFKGIIGYHIWSSENGHLNDGFIQDALHDLDECVEHHDTEWYSPRTSRYIEYYRPDGAVADL